MIKKTNRPTRSLRIRIRNSVFGKRKVTLDTSVILSDIVFDSKTAKEAVGKSTTDDEIMFTTIIYDECINFTGSKKNRKNMTKDEMDKQLKERFGGPIEIDTPSVEEMKKKYWVRDDEDLKILHSAELTRSKIIVTRDDDLLDPNMKGPKKVRIVEMYEYIGRKKSKK